MPDSQGQPLPGEWWETRNHERAYVVASLPENLPIQSSPHSHLAGWVIADGRIRGVSWSRKGEWIAECDGGCDLVKHLPDCDSWDWQPPDLPVKPPEPANTSPAEQESKALWEAIRDLQQRMAAHEDRDKFFESVI